MIRRLAAVLGCVATLAALLAPAVVSAPPAAAQDSGTLRLASQTPWLEPGGAFVLRVQVAGVPRPDLVDLRIVIHRAARSRSQFELTIDGQQLGATVFSRSATLDQLDLDAAGARTVELPQKDLRLSGSGVYPVEVSLRAKRGGTLDSFVTHLVYVSGPLTGPQLGVSWVLPVHHDPATQPSGQRRLGDTAGLATLGEFLAAPRYRDVPLVLAPTPETLDALASGGDGDAEILDAIRRGTEGRQVLADHYVPVDTGSLVDAGLADEEATQRAQGRDIATSALGTDVDIATWLGDERFGATELARATDLSADRVIVPEQVLAPVRPALDLTLAQPFQLATRTGRPVTAAMADEGLAAHFRAGGDQVLAAHQFLADLAQLWLDAPQRERAVVVVTPRRWNVSRSFLEAALDGLVSSPAVKPMSLDTLFDTIPAATARRNAPLVRELGPPSRTPVSYPVTALRDARRHLAALESTLPPGDQSFDDLDRRLLVSESTDLSSRRRSSYLTAVDASIAAHLAQLVLPQSRTVTLTAREGEIPLSFLNRSPVPIQVVVRLDSEKLTFPSTDTTRMETPIELPPGNTTRRVKVQARTSGQFPLDVSVRSPQGGLVIGTTRLTVRSTAASGVGVLLSAGAGAFLLVWWGRHLVRGRRARKLVPA